MASFGNFNAALSSFRAEATNALVNVNLEINFSKFVKPPPEYDAIGQNLARSRRDEAQNGARHILARKLGLLFKNHAALPLTPNLIKAYGERASEIARSSTANPRGQSSHGPFAEIIGADATTLWAAATSGRRSLQCHLLACFLARMWEPTEATSIWVEMISRRRKELQEQLEADGELDNEVLLAAISDYVRSDIHNWDASARAWLRAADGVMNKQQIQLRLIVDNLDMPVNMKPDTYLSVIEAWASAMTQMENLLMGVPLQVYSGDILVGLLSWHIYPDMLYLSRKDQKIDQGDHLVKGRGILTLGLEPSPTRAKDCQSVYWALPLAHLRYYGLPVTRMTTIRLSDKDRLTVDEMLWAFLSAYIIKWDDGSVPAPELLQYISDVAIQLHWNMGYEYSPKGKGHLDDETQRKWKAGREVHKNDSWLTMFSRIALLFKDRLDDQRVRKLRNMGQRYYPPAFNPFQGIFGVETFLQSARRTEDMIGLLRLAALSMATQSSPYEFLIVLKKKYFDSATGEFCYGFEFVTAVPDHQVTKTGWDTDTRRQHRRWISSHLSKQILKDRLEQIISYGEKAEVVGSISYPVFLRKPKSSGLGDSSESGAQYRNFSPFRTTLTAHFGPKGTNKTRQYRAVYGDSNEIALLRMIQDQPEILHPSGSPKEPESGEYKFVLKIPQIMKLFRPENIRFKDCARMFDLNAPEHDVILGLTLVDSLYKTLPNATVDVRVIQEGFEQAHWITSMLSPRSRRVVVHQARHRRQPKCNPQDLTVAECFACIAMMETGSYNLHPEDLNNVFALSSADSLYISSAVLEDPATNTSSAPIQRLAGNIGRAGVAFLVPPQNPETKSYDTIDEWYCLDHKDFDGVVDDCFQGTSLHLSFSEACQPLNVQFSGNRDVEAYFIEALVSVYDHGKWVSELDILGSLRSQRILREYLHSKPCQCSPAQPLGSRIISIDNYAEMVVPPKAPGIVRAKGNWQARLVAAAICIAKGHCVILKSENTCWNCFYKLSMNGRSVQEVLKQTEQGAMIVL
ncbi:unnamed protein product [Clonostachys byssicola]|uniref:Uncharacterized protein n=1 Tax=Clonostachys byssicola TaxID=160290 RepID=A0A9N9UD08_9HYPO|nr:unnamed protein product [Clonostachys byssicola]